MEDLLSAFRFVRDDDEDAKTIGDYKVRDAVRYYQQLYREYAIMDLTHFQDTKIGMRWRLEREVIEGKGETICCVKGCHAREALNSYEIPFCYEEDGARKTELVKARVCPACLSKLRTAGGAGTAGVADAGAGAAPVRKRSKKNTA